MAMIFLFTLLVERIINLKCSTHFSWILGLSLHSQAPATYAQLSVCSNYFSIPAIVYFLANFNFYDNMEFNPSFTHSKLYKYTV